MKKAIILRVFLVLGLVWGAATGLEGDRVETHQANVVLDKPIYLENLQGVSDEPVIYDGYLNGWTVEKFETAEKFMQKVNKEIGARIKKEGFDGVSLFWIYGRGKKSEIPVIVLWEPSITYNSEKIVIEICMGRYVEPWISLLLDIEAKRFAWEFFIVAKNELLKRGKI